MIPFPFSLRQAHQLCTRRYALDNIHFPADHRALSVARRRLVFEELLLLQRPSAAQGPFPGQDRGPDREGCVGGFLASAPFFPDRAQRRAVADCVRDMQSGAPMSRLVQGTWAAAKPPWPPAWRSL